MYTKRLSKKETGGGMNKGQHEEERDTPGASDFLVD